MTISTSEPLGTNKACQSTFTHSFMTRHLLRDGECIANDKRAAMNRRRMPGTRVQSLNRSPRVRPGFRRLPVAVDAGRTPGAGATGTRGGEKDARVRAETARRARGRDRKRVGAGKRGSYRVDTRGR